MSEEIPLYSKISTSFDQDIIHEFLKSKYSNSKYKISNDALVLITDLAKMLVIETAARACNEAQSAGKDIVELEDVEVIYPQIALDF